MNGPTPGRESGDRAAFVARLAKNIELGSPLNHAHPLPAPVRAVPRPRSSMLGEDLIGSFIENARAVSAVVHDVVGEPSDTTLRDIVDRHRVRSVVRSDEPAAIRIGERLAAWGIEVRAHSIEAAAEADLGITGCRAAIATTGTVVLDAGAAGGRTMALLPPVHLCIIDAAAIVATSADVLVALDEPGALPSNLALVTGPSRSGDIEQIISLGVHGPTAVEHVVIRPI